MSIEGPRVKRCERLQKRTSTMCLCVLYYLTVISTVLYVSTILSYNSNKYCVFTTCLLSCVCVEYELVNERLKESNNPFCNCVWSVDKTIWMPDASRAQGAGVFDMPSVQIVSFNDQTHRKKVCQIVNTCWGWICLFEDFFVCLFLIWFCYLLRNEFMLSSLISVAALFSIYLINTKKPTC